MKCLILAMSIVWSGLALGNTTMLYRLVGGQPLINRVDSAVSERVVTAINRALPYVKRKNISAPFMQAVQEEMPAPDFGKLAPAHRQLPDYMQDEQGLTYDVLEYPLHVAVAVGDYGEVERLLADDKANVDAFDRRGRTPMHIAVEAGDLDMVGLLIEHRAEVNTPIAEWRWFYKIVDRLNNGKDRLARYKSEGRIKRGDAEPLVRSDGEIVKLKKKEHVLNWHDGFLTPTRLAIRDGHLDILALLLLEGASIEPIANSHHSIASIRTPARMAASKGDLASILLLDAAGADLAEVEVSNFTNTFRMAVANERWNVVEYLLDKMPDEIIKDGLQFAKSATMFTRLKEAIPEVPLATIEGRLKGDTLLASHVRSGNTEVVKLMIDEYGMNSNAKDDRGRTLLHLALLYPNKNKETVLALLQRDADPSAKHKWGTPFDMARSAGLGHLFLPYMDKQQEVPDDVSQLVARRNVLENYAQ